MPRLPDLNDLGGRPAPQSSRAIATNPRAGVVGDAVAGLGQTVGRVGEQMIEKEDKLNFAAAKASLLRADIATRQELDKDPDYTTYESRYAEKMKGAQTAAAGMIRSKSDRTLFEADASVDFERGRAAVMQTARGKEVVSGKATLSTGLENLRDVGREAIDEPTREAAVKTAGDLIDGAVAKGYLDPVEAAKQREDFTSEYVTEQVSMMINREDPIGAKDYFDKHRSMIDWRTGLALEGRLKGSLDNREAVDVVDGIMGGATRTGDTPVAYTDALRGRGTGISDGYGKARASGTHNGVDFTAKIGTPIFSIGAGTVQKVGSDARSGNFVIIDHGNGRTSSYSHMNGQSVKEGDVVTPDTQLGAVGMTGHTTGPHLHLVVKDNGQTVDPTKVIGAAQSPQRHDLNSIYSQIDTVAHAQNWTPEKIERVKQEADRRVSRDETLANRAENEAMRTALDSVDSLGDRFTDVSQIPNYSSLAPQDRITLRGRAESNRVPKTIPANGDAAVSLERASISAPDAFIKEDLRKYQGQMTPAEYASMLITQEKMKAEGANGKTASIRSNINSTIDFFGKTDRVLGAALDPKRNPAAFMRTFKDMEGYITSITGGKRDPSDAELETAFKRATTKVFVNGDEKPRFELPGNARYQTTIPIAVRNRIVTNWKLTHGGQEPPDGVIGDLYIQNKGKKGYWN